MMATPTPYVQKPGRVFVGNIPMYATEEELASACSVFGPVVSFKLIIDKNTGKHKGYGFCEFRDEETALSAHRNQKGLLCQGRQLRVGMVHSGEERRKHLANKNIKVPTTSSNIIKEQKIERRELDVFALRQLMKLRQAAMAAKCNPKKRGNPSDGSSTVAAGGPPAKKPSMTKMYEEDRPLRQAAGKRTAVVDLEYYSTSTKTLEGQTHEHDTRRTKEMACCAGTDQLAANMHTTALPPGGIIKKELDLHAGAASSTSTLAVLGCTKAEVQTHHDIMRTLKENPCTGCGPDQLALNDKASSPLGGIKKELDNMIAAASSTTAGLDYDLQRPNIHADLIALLDLLKGAPTSGHHLQYQHMIREPKHSLQDVASAA